MTREPAIASKNDVAYHPYEKRQRGEESCHSFQKSARLRPARSNGVAVLVVNAVSISHTCGDQHGCQQPHCSDWNPRRCGPGQLPRAGHDVSYIQVAHPCKASRCPRILFVVLEQEVGETKRDKREYERGIRLGIASRKGFLER